MTLNPDVVRARCADIEDAVAALQRFVSMPVEEFRADRDLADAACRRPPTRRFGTKTISWHATTHTFWGQV